MSTLPTLDISWYVAIDAHEYLSQFTGSGNFGNCYLKTYCAISLLIRQYEEKHDAGNNSHNLPLFERGKTWSTCAA